MDEFKIKKNYVGMHVPMYNRHRDSGIAYCSDLIYEKQNDSINVILL